MKKITKRNEPASLTEYRASQHAFYKDLDKTDVRASLLTEQGHLCCYCMKRIPETNVMPPGSKIEHFLCQDEHSQEELNYNNMLLACLGKQGFLKELQTCDTRKGNSNLSFSPSNRARNIEGLISYKANGEIYSSDNMLNVELESVLNLNVKFLKDNRRVIYEEVRNRIRIEGNRRRNRTVRIGFLEKEKEKLLARNFGKFSEFCMVGVYVIDKKLNKIA